MTAITEAMIENLEESRLDAKLCFEVTDWCCKALGREEAR